MGVRPLAFHQRRWDDGRTLLRAPLGDAVVEAFGFPHYQTHRADLLATLVGRPAGGAPARRAPVPEPARPRRPGRGRRSTNGATADVDVLVGADGIHSDVRAALFGPEDPVFTGCAAYRGLVPAERLRHLELEVTAQIWMGPGAHFVHYFVQQRRLVNFVAIFDQDTWTRESWTDRGEVADALAAFEGWHPQVQAIIGAVDETFIWALFDRPPLPRWSSGRVTLLGDACHPMLPFMAQGAAQGLEDGATLTACLEHDGPDVPRRCAATSALRLPRASRIQAMSSENKTRFHLPDGPEQRSATSGWRAARPTSRSRRSSGSTPTTRAADSSPPRPAPAPAARSRPPPGRTSARIASTNSTTANGRSRNAPKSPSETSSVRRNCASISGPRITPRITGATGKSKRRMKKPSTPITYMTSTSVTEPETE